MMTWVRRLFSRKTPSYETRLARELAYVSYDEAEKPSSSTSEDSLLDTLIEVAAVEVMMDVLSSNDSSSSSDSTSSDTSDFSGGDGGSFGGGGSSGDW